MSDTTNVTREQIFNALQERIGAQEPVTPEPTAAPATPSSLFKQQAEATPASNMKEYAEIIGEAHPSGKKYYFTVYEKGDWDVSVQALIPEPDSNHVFDHDYALSVLMGIEFDKPVFAYGPPGSGKSVTPEQICALLNYPYMFVAGMGGTEPSDYVGSPWVSNGNMEWKDGPMSYAVRHGVFLLYDEPFKSSAQTNMCMQSLLDSRRTLKLYGHPDPVQGNLKAHPKFRIIQCDNVRGTGDQMDRYAAEIQDQSTLNRSAYKVQVDYLPADREATILENKYPDLTKKLGKKIVTLAGLLRKAWDNGDIEMPYSVRDTQELAEAALFHQSVATAFKQTYLSSVRDDTERATIIDLWNTVKFGEEKL